MAEDIASKIPNNLGIYLEVGLGIVILLFIGFGLLKNWKLSLIQMVLFIVALVSVKAICDNIYVSNADLRNSVDQIAQKLATTIQNANSKIGNINSDTGTNLPTIDGTTVNSSFIGLAYTIIAAVASIGYALIALLISFLLALGIYFIIRHFIKDNPKYQNISKKFWYKAIGIVPNFVLGLMFGSLVISPIYISRNIAINTVKYPVSLGYTLPEKFSEEILKFAEYKLTVYGYLATVESYQEEIKAIEPSINEINVKITNADKQISTVYETFNGDYLNKANVVKANYKTKLTDTTEASKCEVFINSYFEAKTEFDSDYKAYTGTKNDVDSTIKQFNTAKTDLEDSSKKLQELAASKIDLQKLITQFLELEQYETKIKNVLPDLKVFGWLVIDCGMYNVNIDGTKYYYQDSYNKLFNYVKDYISELIEKFKEKSPDIIKKYDEEVAKVDAEIEKYQSELDKKIDEFNSGEITSRVDSTLSEIEKYQSEVKTTKENIDYWYNKVK